MFDQLINRWWIVAVRGLVAVVFGMFALLAPVKTMAVLTSLFGMFVLADGFFTLGAGLSLNWLSLFLEGVVGVAFGAFVQLYPPAAEMWFSYLIISWAFVIGVLELGAAIRLRAIGDGPIITAEWLLALSGVVSVIFAFLVAARSDVHVVAFMSTLGGYAVVSGLLLLALALNIRHWPKTIPSSRG